MSVENLKKAIKEKNLTIGTEETIKSLKKGDVKEVFVAKNCPGILRRKVKNYSEMTGATVSELEETNEEIGSICKKPFSINLCCY
jgi:large subunit ribosomal protein L30e